jgi:TonB family protein
VSNLKSGTIHTAPESKVIENRFPDPHGTGKRENPKMFNNLVESDAHKEDHRRKASFFIYTLIGYAVLLLAAGVASVYAYDAQLETQSLELQTLVEFVPPDSTPKTLPTERRVSRSTATTNSSNAIRVPVRPVLLASAEDPLKVPDKVGTNAVNIPPAPPNAIIGSGVSDPRGSGPIGPPSRIGDDPAASGSAANPIREELPPPPVIKKPKPPTVVSLGAVNGRAIDLPKPPYPAIAKPVGASGAVTVEILLDETGKVISAHAVSGHPLLRAAAVKAAYQARFSPTLLSKQPVKASGIITYQFTLH